MHIPSLFFSRWSSGLNAGQILANLNRAPFTVVTAKSRGTNKPYEFRCSRHGRHWNTNIDVMLRQGGVEVRAASVVAPFYRIYLRGKRSTDWFSEVRGRRLETMGFSRIGCRVRVPMKKLKQGGLSSLTFGWVRAR